MIPQSTNILVLDDESEIRSEINEFLTSDKFQVSEAATPTEAFRILSGIHIDIAILDLRLPEMNGLEVLKEIRRRYPHIHVMMMSGHGDMDTVIEALRLGAVDYFQKPFLLKDMYRTILKSKKILDKIMPVNGAHFDHVLKHSFGETSSESLIVVSESMKFAVERMRLVARSHDTTVLITGESGTGKELIARGIHFLSARKDKPFLAVNCSTMPDELFESEFFGYKKGAFTGANTDKPGWFEAADGGTIFLDEIGDLKPNLQAKLLRIMEDKVVSRLGSVTTKKINVRVISATNQDLQQLISENRFRRDLYHRINTIVINVPPLRERKEGIPMLFSHFLEYYAQKLEQPLPQVDKNVLDALLHYDFPGNVRELKHMVERAMVLCEGVYLTFEHFEHLKIKMQQPSTNRQAIPANFSLTGMEKQTIEAVLKESTYNKSKAARALNISRQALDRKIKRLGIVR